uniref:ENTH domain-containing protein n=1 Tax=Fagus sylvatica TaxID=28930 RepID=A0A2N9ECT8_FAGSY
MMSRFWQVITALREHSQVSYTKIATLSDFCDVELIIIKATAPNDLPFPEHYIHELLKIFTIPPSSFRAFSLSFTRRFGRTWCWRVALKCLLLLHRLLRSYAQLLDEALNCFVLDSNAKDYYLEDEEDKNKPTELAARSFIVRSAMKHIIRDSFICYKMFRTEIVVVLENLFHMPYRSGISAFGVYKKAAVQANQLCEFYDWCKMTDSSLPSVESDESSLTEDNDRQVVPMDIIVGEWVSFEDNALVRDCEVEQEMEPLIKFDDGENVGWEALLEASVNLSCASKSFFVLNHSGCDYGYGNEYEYDNCRKNGQGEDMNTWWKMQVYNPNALNPFCQPYNVSSYHGLYPNNNMSMESLKHHNTSFV